MTKIATFILCAACLAGRAGAQIYDLQGIQLSHGQMEAFYRGYGDRYALTAAGVREVDGQSVVCVSGRVMGVLPEGWVQVWTREGRVCVVQPRVRKAYADQDPFFGAGVRTGVYVVSNGTAHVTHPLVAGGELTWKEFVDAASRGRILVPREFHPPPVESPKPNVIAPQGFRMRKAP